MKKNIKIALVLSSISMALGCAVGINNLTDRSENHANAIASTSYVVTPDTASNLTYSWYRSSNPSNYDKLGDVGGFSVGSTTTLGLSNDNGEGFNLTYNSSTVQNRKKFEIETKSSMDSCVAFYQPFYFKKVIAANTLMSEKYKFSVQITGSSSAIKSAELFYFADIDNNSETTTTMPSRFWFTSGDTTTTNTGMAHSLGRFATNLTSATGEIFTDTFNVQNETNNSLTVYFHFGLFAYKQKSNSAQSMKITVTHASTEGGLYNGSITANGKLYFDLDSALADYNSKDNSEIRFATDQTLASDITFASNGGHVYLASRKLICGNYKVNVAGNTTFHGYGDIKGTGDRLLYVDTPDVTVTLDGEIDVYTSGLNTLYMTSNALNSKVIVNSAAKLRCTSAYTTSSVVILENGSFVAKGYVHASSYGIASIIFKGNSDFHRHAYLSGQCDIQGFISLNSPADSDLHASYEDVAYEGSQYIQLKLNSAYMPGDAVVYEVNSGNSSRFSIDANYCSLYGSTNLILAKRNYVINRSFTGIQFNGNTTGNYYEEYTCTLTPYIGFIYGTLTITIGNNITLVEGSDYSFDTKTGTLTIFKNKITGVVTISMKGDSVHIIEFINVDNSTASDTENYKNGETMIFPTPTYGIPEYMTFIGWTENKDGSGTVYHVGDEFTVDIACAFYAQYERTDTDAVNMFVDTELHFGANNLISTTNNADTGACRGDNGYYATAKTAYNSLTDSQKALLCTNANYADARSRLEAWARANSETLDLTTYQLTSFNARVLTALNSSDTTLMIIMIAGLISISAIALLLLKRKNAKR